MIFCEIVKKPLVISIIVSLALITSLGLLFLDDYYNNTDNEIINQLERDGIKAVAMLTIDDDWGNAKSKSITESFFVNDMLAPKIEIKFDAENPNYDNMSVNLSMAIKEHLNNYNSNEIAVVVIGLEDKESLNIAIYGDNLKLSSLEWIWISE